MLWRDRRQSENVQDLRGAAPRGGGFGRGGLVGGGLGGVAVLLIALFFGVDPSILLDETGYGDPRQGSGYDTGAPYGYTAPQHGRSASDDELKTFVATVLADTEDTWNRVFRDQLGREYREPTLVLFTGAVNSGCGAAQAAMGPFYCPLDERIYIDLGFYRDLRDRFGAPGDFAQAYVLAHEVGHHVQNLLGISDEIQAARRRASPGEGNALSVRLELQADCLAGFWGDAARRAGTLEPGDVEEAITAASAVGDDRIQRQARGTVDPESFTHGSARQRAEWFLRGYRTGDLRACDTFGEATAER